MTAVKASIPARDVKAILAHQRSSGPVHLQLYTACDEEKRCTIFTTMDFSDPQSDTTAISLRVDVRVMQTTDGQHRKTGASWQVHALEPGFKTSTTYAGDFSNTENFPSIDKNHAIASVLTAIEAAIKDALNASGTNSQAKAA